MCPRPSSSGRISARHAEHAGSNPAGRSIAAASFAPAARSVFSDNRIAVTDEWSGLAATCERRITRRTPAARARSARASAALGKSSRLLSGEVQVRLLPEALDLRVRGATDERSGLLSRWLQVRILPHPPFARPSSSGRMRGSHPRDAGSNPAGRSSSSRAWPSGRGAGLPSRTRGFESRCPLHRRGVVQWQDAGPWNRVRGFESRLPFHVHRGVV